MAELPAEWSAAEFCYLTTTGRRSGRPHTVEIWYAVRGDRIYLLAGGGPTADWVRNLQADPAVTVRVGEDRRRGRAYVVSDTEEAETARALLVEKYQPGYSGDLAGWRDRGLPVGVAQLTVAEPPPDPDAP